MRPSAVMLGAGVLVWLALGIRILSALLLPGPSDQPTSGVISFEANGQRCFTIPGEAGTGNGGRGGSATVCGEGSQARPGAAGGSTRVPPTYTIRNGNLLRVLADGRTEPVEVR